MSFTKNRNQPQNRQVCLTTPFPAPHLRDQRLARGNVSLHLSLRRPPSATASSNKIASD